MQAALEGQNMAGIIKAAGIGAASAILARLIVYKFLLDELNPDELALAQRLIGITGKNVGDAAVSAWELISR